MANSTSHYGKAPVRNLLSYTEPYQDARKAEVPIRLKTMGTFDERVCPSLTVAITEHGKLAVVDGLARASLAERDRGGDYEIYCQFLEGLTYEERAEIFLVLDRRRKNITPIQRFFAQREAREPATLEIVKILSDEGVTVALPSQKHKTPTQYTAVVRVEEAYGMNLLREAVHVIQAGMKGRDDATDGSLLGAVARILKRGNTAGESVNQERLAAILHDGSVDIFRDTAHRVAKMAFSSGPAEVISLVRAGIIIKFNHRCPKGDMLSTWWNNKSTPDDE
jgi:hypothetical protein